MTWHVSPYFLFIKKIIDYDKKTKSLTNYEFLWYSNINIFTKSINKIRKKKKYWRVILFSQATTLKYTHNISEPTIFYKTPQTNYVVFIHTKSHQSKCLTHNVSVHTFPIAAKHYINAINKRVTCQMVNQKNTITKYFITLQYL